jgi:hypothetical protein
MKRFAFTFILLTGISLIIPAQRITTGTLFEEMIDLKRLSSVPDPYYDMVQFSSCDHRSTLPGGPDWWANSDGFGGEPVPNFEEVIRYNPEEKTGEFVVADVEGPGAIVRLWTASINGGVKMYIDDMDDPVFDGPAQTFFDAPYSHYEKEFRQVDKELFNKTVCQRDASYAPIPFAQRLRVVWSGNPDELHFYQMQVRLYDRFAEVQSFTPEDIRRYAEVINRVAAVLDDPDKYLPAASESLEKLISTEVKQGETGEALLFEGSSSIQKLVLKVDAGDPDLALRQTILHIYFDGFPWAQVQSPVGDFFGAAPGINPYRSLPFTVEPDGTMTCRYIMPFESSCRIHIQNLGDQDVTVSGNVSFTGYSWDSRSMHFRARWRADHNLQPTVYHAYDVPFLLAVGQGTYVGTTSILMNTSDVPTPWGNWWGEGDEKVFVDNRQTPGLFGTGSEDYYNYSWSSPDIFIFPYCGQPRNDGPGNRGFVTNYRWHILDPVPFQKEIRFYMELYTHRPAHGMSFARIGYHYARPGVTDDHFPIMQEDVRKLELPAGWQPVASHGSRNSVFYQAEDVMLPDPYFQIYTDNLYAGGELMVWKPESDKESLDLAIPVKEDGNYRIWFTVAHTPNSGRFSVSLDGKKAKFSGGKPVIDLYEPYRTMLRNYFLEPVVELKKDTKLEITVHYNGSQSPYETDIGIDFIWLQKME